MHFHFKTSFKAWDWVPTQVSFVLKVGIQIGLPGELQCTPWHIDDQWDACQWGPFAQITDGLSKVDFHLPSLSLHKLYNYPHDDDASHVGEWLSWEGCISSPLLRHWHCDPAIVTPNQLVHGSHKMKCCKTLVILCIVIESMLDKQIDCIKT